MISRRNIERLIYAVVILLSLAALTLVAISPSEFRSSKVVYQGF